MKHKIFVIIFLLSTITSVLALAESEKILKLLDSIERSNLIFIRNGVEYSSRKARKHLELKMSKVGSRIHTAEQFIEYIASKSTWTGEPYYLKFKDGTIMKTADWLQQILAEMEKSSD